MTTVCMHHFLPDGDWPIVVVEADRGWGKTRSLMMEAAAYAVDNPHSIVHVVCPTEFEVESMMFDGPDNIVDFLGPDKFTARRYERKVSLTNGSIIWGFSTDYLYRMRGTQCHFAVVDNIDHVEPDRLRSVVQNILQTVRLPSDNKVKTIITSGCPMPQYIANLGGAYIIKTTPKEQAV